MVTIEGCPGHFNGVSIPLPPGRLTLGREQPGKGRLSFDKSSDMRHVQCTVKYDERTPRFTVTDLGSSNDTFLMPVGGRLDSHEQVHWEAG